MLYTSFYLKVLRVPIYCFALRTLGRQPKTDIFAKLFSISKRNGGKKETGDALRTFYLCSISDSRIFIVIILTWSIQNTVHWKLSFIMLPLFTKGDQYYKTFCMTLMYRTYLYSKISLHKTILEQKHQRCWCKSLNIYWGKSKKKQHRGKSLNF